ncbi:sensor histidine kinase [Streptomyces sp. SID12501]|uniref:histidine kinase n=2 Tax=Streptomyces sp. SID12501 TaxID=2706042 RepID=A0A6B3C1G3_9ACTN|nr:sensor histidine kinase [Streptomyces sp. SID12501]
MTSVVRAGGRPSLTAGRPLTQDDPVQPTTGRAAPVGVGERIMAAIIRDPRSAPHAMRNDVLLALTGALIATALALLTDGGSSRPDTLDQGGRPNALGWALLLGAYVPIVWRRRRPTLVLVGVLACVVPYHALDYNHTAPTPASYIALYTVAVTGRPLRTIVTGVVVLGITLSVMLAVSMHQAVELVRISGWVVAVLFCGIDVRFYRQYVSAIVERAERAERTREEEARRRVAEERLRVARDLHDLLAHTITLVGVQTAVAAHVLAADPDRLDRTAVAKALDDIAETCRTARGELRTTLEVLREGQGGAEGRGPLPGIAGLPDLAETARAAGAEVELEVRAHEVPPAVGAAAYRIVQEALTNAVRHGGREDLTVRVLLYGGEGALRVEVTDDGVGEDASCADGITGFGLVGMRERARSVGGTLDAGPGEDRGFTVSAVLPLPVNRARESEREVAG